MTEYVILTSVASSDGENQRWEYLGHQEGRSDRSAIRAFLDGSAQTGDFLAIPVRSYRPVTVKVETKTALKFS